MKHLQPFENFSTSVAPLHEATYAGDIDFIHQAEVLYELVYNALKAGQYQMSSDAFVLFGRDLDPRFSDLKVMFVHPSHPVLGSGGGTLGDPSMSISYALGTTKDKRYRVLVCSNLLNPGDNTYIETRLNKAGFCHEVIHYLDGQRYKGGAVRSSATSANLSDYYNHASEFNAYYLEASGSIRTMMQKPFLRSKFLTGFETFRDFATRMMDKNFIRNLNPSYKKKLDKRLSAFYNGLLGEEVVEQ